jgi:hypothetical protein
MLSPNMYVCKFINCKFILDAFYMGVQLWLTLNVCQCQMNKNVKKDVGLLFGFQCSWLTLILFCNTVKYLNTTELVLLYAASTEGTLV